MDESEYLAWLAFDFADTANILEYVVLVLISLLSFPVLVLRKYLIYLLVIHIIYRIGVHISRLQYPVIDATTNKY